MQKKLLIGIVGAILAIAIILLLRPGDEPAQPATDAEPTIVEEQAAPEPSETESGVEDDGETTIVEESASEPDEDEQAIMLAQAEAPAATYDWAFQEGKHYKRLVPTQPTWGGADKIEIAEFFWYGCPHCYTAEPIINAWVANDMPATARFVRIPATWNNILVLHAQLFYTEQVLVRNGVIKDGEEFRAAVFEEYHQRGNRLASESAIQKLFERFGVSADEFAKAWNSFEVAQNMRKAGDLARRYTIASVPAIIVNGKYHTSAREVGGMRQWMDLIDELIVRESAR